MLIFGYTDHEDDRLQVETRESGDFLAFRIPEDRDNQMDARGVDIPRNEVLRLYSALGEWLYPVHTPEGPNRSLIEELIAKAVKDQVAAILPLHLAPKPFVPFTSCACHDSQGHSVLPDPEPEQCRGEYGCDALGTHAAYGSGCGRLGDPEPRDVGHVEEPAKPYQRPCDAPMEPGQRLSDVHEACGFLWALHKVIPPADAPQSRCEGCKSGNHPHVFKPCERPGCECRETVPEPEHGRLMTELPRRTRPRTAPKCLDCLHGWGEHMGGICWGMTPMQERDGEAGCTCTRERPGTAGTVLCTCPRYATHPHGPDGCMHPSCTCKQKRQVRS